MVEYPALTTRQCAESESRDDLCKQERRGKTTTAMRANVTQRENATDCENRLQLPACTPDAHGGVVVIR